MKGFIRKLEELNPCCKKTNNNKTKENNYINKVKRESKEYAKTKLNQKNSKSLEDCLYNLETMKIDQTKSRSLGLDNSDCQDLCKKFETLNIDSKDLKYNSLIDNVIKKDRKNYPIFRIENYKRLNE